MNRCAPVSEIESKVADQLNNMRRLFNGEKSIDVNGKKVFIGDSIKNSYGKTTEASGERMFNEIVFRATYKPAQDNFTGFVDQGTGKIKKADFVRIKNEIIRESKNLTGKNIGVLERLFGVKRGVMSKWAITNWMNKQLNLVTNYERTQFSNYISSNTAISKYLRAEILRRNGQSKWKPGIDAVQKLDKLERELTIEMQNPQSDQQLKSINEKRRKILEIYEEKGGEVVDELRQYLETEPDARGRILKKESYVDETGKRVYTGKKVKYNVNVELAGQEARAVLDRMGGVLINGLRRHGVVIDHLFNNAANSTREKYKERLEKEIKNIEKGMKKGNYFPHYLMEAFYNMERIVNEATNNVLSREKQEDKLGELDSIVSSMRQNLGTPRSSHGRAAVPYDLYLKNPLSVLRKYSMDAISFNRVNHIKDIYLTGLKSLPKDPEVAKALREYIDDMFTLAERGYQDRPAWVNKTVRALTGMEFLSKIGFGVATAARNTLSGLYFIQSVGNRSFINYLRTYDKNENSRVREIIERVEQEQGFKFEDLSSPLFTEGLLPTEGVNIRDVDIKEVNGEMKLVYKDSNAWKTFDSSLTYASGKGAIFQKVTENFLRKHMFRYAFMNKFNELVQGGMSSTDKKAERFATEHALNIVNKYAFEYAAHQKAPVTGGTSSELGAVGQVAAQFMHYPFSFLQMQSEVLRKSADAAMAKQWDSPDLYIPLRFAGLYMMTSLMSGVFNLDFHRLIENDTIDRVKDIVDVVNGEDDVKGRGYLAPAVGDLFFLASLMEFVEMDDNSLNNLIVGYNNAYSLTDEQKASRLLGTINVQTSKILTKDYKALQNGNGWNVLMHEFGLYPRAWTRKMRQTPFKPLEGKFGVKALFPDAGKKKKSSKKLTSIQAPSTGILGKKSKVLQSISKIQNTPEAKNHESFQKDNVLKAIGLIKKQQQEEEKVYDPKNNRRMILQ